MTIETEIDTPEGSMTVTTVASHCFKPGDRLSIKVCRHRPPWWRLLALWRWYRNQWRDFTGVVTEQGLAGGARKS